MGLKLSYMGLKLTYLGLKLKEKTINTNFEKITGEEEGEEEEEESEKPLLEARAQLRWRALKNLGVSVHGIRVSSI